MIETLSTDVPISLQTAVHRCLAIASERELKLATADSCTGGLLASLLTDVEGFSHILDRGFVAYSDDAKRIMLDVASNMLDRHGAVSRPVAVAMAQNALEKSLADVAVAITGFAGPAGDGDEEGLVHFACARRRAKTLHREAHYGPLGRGPIRIECLRTAIEMLEERLNE